MSYFYRTSYQVKVALRHVVNYNLATDNWTDTCGFLPRHCLRNIDVKST